MQLLISYAPIPLLMQLFVLSESMEKNFRKSILWDMAPNVICISGAFFFHLSIFGAPAINSVGLAGGVINGMLPAIKANKGISLSDFSSLKITSRSVKS